MHPLQTCRHLLCTQQYTCTRHKYNSAHTHKHARIHPCTNISLHTLHLQACMHTTTPVCPIHLFMDIGLCFFINKDINSLPPHYIFSLLLGLLNLVCSAFPSSVELREEYGMCLYTSVIFITLWMSLRLDRTFKDTDLYIL